MFGRPALCATLLLLLPTLASASPLVVYGPGFDAADAAVAAKEALGSGDFRVHGSLTALTGEPGAPVVVGTVGRACTSAAEPLDRVLTQARLQVLELEYASALTSLTAAVDQLPCGAESASRDHLFELFFLQGYMHFNEGQQDDARAAFAQAAAIDRNRDWPKEYPPTAKTAYLEGLQQAVGGDPATLRAETDALSIDGATVDVTAPPALVEGGHLVVVSGRALWVTVGPRAERPAAGLLVTTSDRLAGGIAAGNDAYAPWLVAACGRLGAASLLVITKDGPRYFTDGNFALPPKAITAGPSTPSGLVPGAILAGTGGALLGAGLGIHIDAFKAAEPDDSGGVPVAEADYPGLLARNRAGFGLAVGGGVLVGTGVVVIVVSKLTGSPVTATPWIAPSDRGLGFGVTGTF